MSVRSNNVRYNSSLNSSSTTPIDFKEEFSNSAAALAASHDETVSHILSRLDQLQSKISNQPENSTTPPQQQLAASAVKTISTAARKTDGDLNSRLQSLENIHENVLQRLNGKLDSLERRLSENKEAEKLMGQIATKFGHVEARLKENKDAEKLMSQIASKFSHIEAKLQSASRLQERVSDLESRIARTHAPDLQKRVARLEAQAQPDPEHDRIIARINSKLDILERNKRQESMNAGVKSFEGTSKRSQAAPSLSKSMSSPADEARMKELQARIEKLKILRNKYQNE